MAFCRLETTSWACHVLVTAANGFVHGQFTDLVRGENACIIDLRRLSLCWKERTVIIPPLGIRMLFLYAGYALSYDAENGLLGRHVQAENYRDGLCLQPR